MNIVRVGVDIAKWVFHIHGAGRAGRSCWQGKYSRAKRLSALVKRVPEGAKIGLEACASAHHWARELRRRGYSVKLVAAQFVKPYVKSNKNDRVDAEAICEAISRPNMRFVTSKTLAQQDTQAMDRIREELISQRTAKANQIRGLVCEYGLVAPTGIQHLRTSLPIWLEDAENGLSDDFRLLLAHLAEDLRYLYDRVASVTKLIESTVRCDPVASRLLELRGIGPLSASALAAALANAKSFQKVEISPLHWA